MRSKEHFRQPKERQSSIQIFVQSYYSRFVGKKIEVSTYYILIFRDETRAMVYLRNYFCKLSGILFRHNISYFTHTSNRKNIYSEYVVIQPIFAQKRLNLSISDLKNVFMMITFQKTTFDIKVGDCKKYTSVKESTNCPYYNEVIHIQGLSAKELFSVQYLQFVHLELTLLS